MKVRKIIIIFFVSVITLPALSVEPWEWQQEEVSRYFSGLNEIQTQGWGRLSYKVNSVIEKLISDTGEVYRVIPGQTFSIGQAHNGGWIILDISTATKDQDILAFWLAHEWAHQHLGHQANIYNPKGDIWKFRKSPTADEDAADEWAGGFLARNGYPIQRVLNHLNNLPVAHGDYAHSDGKRRARIVAEAYGQLDFGKKKVPCIHKIPCSHTKHPFDTEHQFDTRHPFDTQHPFDTRHPFDQDYYGNRMQCNHRIQCGHRMQCDHRIQCGHRIKCVHTMHQFHTEHEFDYR